jgi:glycosyltransferase involved in cell wall biosynthesis
MLTPESPMAAVGTPGSAPAATVVVPTYNRARYLPDLVVALAGQNMDRPYEVIVVDNGSTDETPLILAELVERFRENPRFVLSSLRLERNRGPCPARNAGWRSGSAPVVAFTDDDCRPSSDWLRRLTEPLIGGGHAKEGSLMGVNDSVGFLQAVPPDGPRLPGLAQGATMPPPKSYYDRRPFSETVQNLAEWGWYETCNIAYRREVLEAMGGFDESYYFYGEDTDLGWRVREAGWSTGFIDSAVVYHELRPGSLRRRLGRVYQVAGVARLAADHPGIRSCFARRWVWRDSHLPALAAAAGLLAGLAAPRRLRPSLAGLGVGIYLEHRLLVRPLPGRRRYWPAALPGALVLDWAEIVVLLRASLKNGVLVI